MKTSTGWIIQWYGVLAASTWNIVVFGSAAFAQSNIVFMTTDDGSQSRLSRFDMGTESYATDTGSAAAFLGVTILNGDVLVSDYIANQIQRFSLDGTYIGPFTSVTSPTFLESDSSGNVYTTRFSLGPAVATRFNSAGVATQTFGGVVEFAGIDADAAGNVYIADNGASAVIRKYAANGTLINSTPVPGTARDLAIDESSNLLYMADEFGGTAGIKIFDVGQGPSLVGTLTTPANSNLVGIHFAKESGNILATDFGGGSNDPRGLEFSPTGVLLREYRAAGADAALDITTFVPEPGSVALLLIGLWSIGSCARRRN